MNPYIYDPVSTSQELSCHKGRERDYLILQKDGALGIETRGWFFGPTDRSKAFCRTVKVYMEREYTLLVRGVVNPGEVEKTTSDLASYRDRLNKTDPELTVDECRKLSQIFMASPVCKLHKIEDDLLRLIISDGTTDDITSSIQQLYEKLCENHGTGRVADVEAVHRFLSQDVEELKKRCSQLFPEGLPESVKARLGIIGHGVRYVIRAGIKTDSVEGHGSAVGTSGVIEPAATVEPVIIQRPQRAVDNSSRVSGGRRNRVCQRLFDQPAVVRPGGKVRSIRPDSNRTVCWVSLYNHLISRCSPYDRVISLDDLRRAVTDMSHKTLLDAAAGKVSALTEVCRASSSGNSGSRSAVKNKLRLAGSPAGPLEGHESYKKYRESVVGTAIEPSLVSYQPGMCEPFFSSQGLPVTKRPRMEKRGPVGDESPKKCSEKPEWQPYPPQKWVRNARGRLEREDSTISGIGSVDVNSGNLVLASSDSQSASKKPQSESSEASATGNDNSTSRNRLDQTPTEETAIEEFPEPDLSLIHTIPELRMFDRNTLFRAKQASVYNYSELVLLFDKRLSNSDSVVAACHLANKIKDYLKQEKKTEKQLALPVEGPLLIAPAINNGLGLSDRDLISSGSLNKSERLYPLHGSQNIDSDIDSDVSISAASNSASNVQGLSGQELSAYYQGIDLAIIWKIDEELFNRLLQGFLKMKELLEPVTVNGNRRLPGDIRELMSKFPHWHWQSPIELNFIHFHKLINNYLLTVNDVDDIERLGIRAVLTPYGPYSRLLQQYPVPGMTGFGLTNWGKTVWINVAIHTMVRTISVEQISQLQDQPEPDHDLARLRSSFQHLMVIGQQTLNGENDLRPAVITTWQRSFIEALIICARAGKLGEMNRWFNVGCISDLGLHDTVLFIDAIRNLTGINDSGSQTFKTTYYHEATFNGNHVYKINKRNGGTGFQSQNILSSSEPVILNPDRVTIEDWFNSIFAMKETGEIQRWMGSELSSEPPFLTQPDPCFLDNIHSPERLTQAGQQDGAGYLFRPPAASTQYLIQTREKCLHKIDSLFFTHMILAIDDSTEHPVLARKALLNSARYEINLLKIKVFDTHDKLEKKLVLQLMGVALHRENQGFYIRLSLDRLGRCEEVQRDNISLPFDQYRHCLGKEWKCWREMIEQEEYIPAYCEYKAVRFEDV